MKKILIFTLAAVCLLALLTACGQKNGGGRTDSGADAESQTISGIVNRLDSYLVLLDDEGNYLVFDFGDDVDQKALAEGDRVTVTYTGELGSENPAPVAVAIQKAP